MVLETAIRLTQDSGHLHTRVEDDDSVDALLTVVGHAHCHVTSFFRLSAFGCKIPALLACKEAYLGCNLHQQMTCLRVGGSDT